MSVTSFGDLVTEAERVLTPLAAAREVDAHALGAAWPDFCRRAIHAITAATGARDPRWFEVDLLVMEAARRVRGARPKLGGQAVAPDSHLARAGVLLGAAGDLLASAPRDSVADPMLSDSNIRAAQGQVAALLAVGAHTAVRALACHAKDDILSRNAARELAGAAMRVEQLATRVFEATPMTVSRADDVAVAVLDHRPPTLVEVIDQWGREARDTIRSTTPSARDLQGLAADLARLATHSRAIVRAAMGEKLIEREQGERLDQALAESASGWLGVAERWTFVHTAQPPSPSKIAASHALGQALIAVTRNGHEWAAPGAIAERVDLVATMRALRRAADISRDVAERQNALPERLAASGQLFAAAGMVSPSVTRLHARLHGGLVQVGEADIKDLAGSGREQLASARLTTRLLDPSARRRTPALARNTLAANIPLSAG